MGRILVIDDQEMIRQALRTVLEMAGHEVTEAANGLEAMRKLRTQPVDLVITDIVMPEKEGLECITDIRKLYPTLPVIAMSGGMQIGDLDVLGLAKRMGARRTFPKPFSMAAMVRAVGEELAASAI